MLERYLSSWVAETQIKESPEREEEAEFTDSQIKEIQEMEEKAKRGKELFEISIQGMELESLRLIVYEAEDLLLFFKRKRNGLFPYNQRVDNFLSRKQRAYSLFSRCGDMQEKLKIMRRGVERRDKPEARLWQETRFSADVENVLGRISILRDSLVIDDKRNVLTQKLLNQMEKKFLREQEKNENPKSTIMKQYSSSLDDIDHLIGEAVATSVEKILDFEKYS